MSHHPYPNPARTRAQLDRHDDETGPLLPPRPLTPFEQQMVEVASAATRALRPQLEAIGTSLRAAFQPRLVGSEEKTR